MIESLVLGFGFAFAAGIQPGPLQAFIFSRVARDGWKRTLPASLAPLISDIPIALLVLFLLHHLSLLMRVMLRLTGGVVLLYFAWLSFRQWRQPGTTASNVHSSAPQTLLQAATVNILNPNPYLGWSLVLGPAVLSAWYQHPMNAMALILSFYCTMVAVLVLTIVLFGTTEFLSENGKRRLILLSSVLLAGIGLYQLGIALIQCSTSEFGI